MLKKLLFATLLTLSSPALAELSLSDKNTLQELCPWLGNNHNLPKWKSFCDNPSETYIGFMVNSLGGIDIKAPEGILISQAGNQQRVVSIILSKRELSGEIPDALGKLSELQILDLGENKITGKIPATLGNLNKLQALHLHQNKLTGEVPETLSKLTNLEVLYIGAAQGGNRLACDKVFPDIINSKLKTLGLANCKLKGNLPLIIETLKQLKMLDLSKNEFTGVIPASWKNLGHLLDINLSNNQITGTIPQGFGSLDKLVSIRLQNNQLNGTIPRFNNSICWLYLQNNHFSASEIEQSRHYNQPAKNNPQCLHVYDTSSTMPPRFSDSFEGL